MTKIYISYMNWEELYLLIYEDNGTLNNTYLTDIINNNNIDINYKTKTGGTLLHMASRMGNIIVVRFLLNNGAIVRTTNIWGNTPCSDCCDSYNAIKANKQNILMLLNNYNKWTKG